MSVSSWAAVIFNGTSNVMRSNTAPDNQGRSIDSDSNNIEFSVCKPGTSSPGPLSGGLEIDFDGCVVEFLCTWHAVTNGGVAAGTTGTHDVPAAGCKMSKRIDVLGDMTIKGVSGSYHELQSNRVDKLEATAINPAHRHFVLELPGKLTLKYLKLTWGQAKDGAPGGDCSVGFCMADGGFIYMSSGTLSINFVYFDGTKTTGRHAWNGGCIYVNNGTVTIKESTFEGFRATDGGAMRVSKTSTAMTIESTTFKNNEADVRFIFGLHFVLTQHI